MKPEKLVGFALAVLLSLALLSVPMAWGATGSNLLTPGQRDSDLKIAILAIMTGQDTIQQAYAHNPAFRDFVDQINATLRRYGFPETAMDLVQSFLMTTCQGHYSACANLIFGLGALPVIATVYLSQVTLPNGFNMGQFLENLASMVDAKVYNLQTLVEYLAAAAYHAQQGSSPTERDLALIARIEILVDKIFPQMQAKGNWEDMTFVSDNMVPFGFVASYTISKNPDLASAFPDVTTLNSLTLIEPNLTNPDAVIEGLQTAALWMLAKFGVLSVGMQNVIVQYVNREGYPGALTDLCRDVANSTFGLSYQQVPVVVITRDGNIACHSPDITDDQAKQVCLTHGFASCINEHRELGSGGGGGGGSALPSPVDVAITLEQHNPPTPACKNIACVTVMGLDIPPREP
jgi:hypothetical protein